MNDPTHCPDCGALVGEPHEDGCDVARCLATGMQRIQCGGELHQHNGITYGEHDGPCGQEVWTGEWPGDADCRRLGFWCYWGPDHGERGWVRCTADDPRATPDLNRLVPECEWDRDAQRWELRT